MAKLIELFVALLTVLVTFAALAAVFTGIGLVVRRGFGLRTIEIDDCFLSFWVGYSATLLFLIIWNFALPIGLPALVAVSAAGGLGLALAGGPLRKLFVHHAFALRWWETSLLAAAVLWVLDHSIAGFTSWDGVLYHVQAVKWAKAYAVVPGLANIHGPLAFNNSSFLFGALVDSGWWEGRGFHVANGVLFMAIVLQGTVGCLRWFRHRVVSRECFGFLILALAFHMVQDIVSYSPDVSLAFLNVSAMALMYRLLDAPDSPAGRTDDAYNLFALAILLAGAVTVKLPAAILAAVALPVTIAVRFRPLSQQGPPVVRSFLLITGAVVVFAGAWIARGIVLSGYPFFPLPLAGLGVDWRAPVEHAILESAYIGHSVRGFTWRFIGSSWVRLFLLRDVNAVLVPAGIAVAVLMAGWRLQGTARRGRILASRTWWTTLPLCVAIGVWFVSAPSNRYVPALFWSLAAVCVCNAHKVVWPTLGVRGRRWATGLLAAIAISPLWVEPGLAAMREDASVPRAILRHNLIVPTTDTALPELGGGVPVTAFQTRSGFTLNVPARKPRDGGGLPNGCWNAPLPCTANPAPNLRLRVPGNMASGFRVDGEWEMQDWPYYWQSYFLPGWRARNDAGSQ